MLFIIVVPSFASILVKGQIRLDVRKYSFSQRTVNQWTELSIDCVHSPIELSQKCVNISESSAV